MPDMTLVTNPLRGSVLECADCDLPIYPGEDYWRKEWRVEDFSHQVRTLAKEIGWADVHEERLCDYCYQARLSAPLEGQERLAGV